MLYFTLKIQLIFVTWYFYIGHSFWNRMSIKTLKKIAYFYYFLAELI